MINLQKYLKRNTIDGHIHLFDKDGQIITNLTNKVVGFCDVDPTSISSYGDTTEYYRDFIENHYNDNIILLATSTNSENMIELHKKWPNIIQGFGEVKCYKQFEDENGVFYDLKLDRLSEYHELLKYAVEHKLPIFIHFSLYSDAVVKRLKSFLNRSNGTNIVLCHCGMDKETDKDFCYHSVVELMKEFPNLWVDVTWEALDYFIQNPFKLLNMDVNRIIVGTDMSRVSMKNPDNINTEWEKVYEFGDIVNSDRNIENLFQKNKRSL